MVHQDLVGRPGCRLQEGRIPLRPGAWWPHQIVVVVVISRRGVRWIARGWADERRSRRDEGGEIPPMLGGGSKKNKKIKTKNKKVKKKVGK